MLQLLSALMVIYAGGNWQLMKVSAGMNPEKDNLLKSFKRDKSFNQ